MNFIGCLSKKTFSLYFIGFIVCAVLLFANSKGDLAYGIGIKITSPSTGQRVPVGELLISGDSSDNGTAECQVYVDWNNQKPYQRATPTGTSGPDDFSTWTFMYNSSYHVIKEGINDLTSKLTCLGSPSNPLAMNKWYSINVTGVNSQGSNTVQLPLPIQPPVQDGNASLLVPPKPSNGSGSNDVQISIQVGNNPISAGAKQSLTVEALDPSTGSKISNAKILVTVADPSGTIIKQFDTADGDLTRSFKVDTAGTFKVTAEVQSEIGSLTKSVTFDVQ
ncbi:MAG: hypothetical protein M3O24_03130 [Thermoproteota archaeon]|nr:hypothetical protein [Thermoproteota archaeon]